MAELDDPDEFEEPPRLGITVPSEWVPGVYANVSFVAVEPHEVTLDFVRVDPWDSNAGVVVARVALTFDAAYDLVVDLTRQLRAWSTAVLSDSGDDGNGQTLYRPDDPDAEAPG